jgi:hypothetical protein
MPGRFPDIGHNRTRPAQGVNPFVIFLLLPIDCKAQRGRHLTGCGMTQLCQYKGYVQR